MKKLLAVVGLFLAAAVSLSALPEPKSPEQKALEYGCAVLNRDCSGVYLPKVQYDYLGMMGIRGTVGILDERVVVILDATLYSGIREGDVRAMAVLVHEMVHAVDIQVGLANLPVQDMANICRSEGRAFHVANQYMIDSGLPDATRYSWLQSYSQCQTIRF